MINLKEVSIVLAIQKIDKFELKYRSLSYIKFFVFISVMINMNLTNVNKCFHFSRTTEQFWQAWCCDLLPDHMGRDGVALDLQIRCKIRIIYEIKYNEISAESYPILLVISR